MGLISRGFRQRTVCVFVCLCVCICACLLVYLFVRLFVYRCRQSKTQLLFERGSFVPFPFVRLFLVFVEKYNLFLRIDVSFHPTHLYRYTFPTSSLILLLIFRTNITCIRNRKLKNICIVLRAARAGHAWRAVFTSVHNRTRSIAEISFVPSFIRPLMYSCVRPFIHSFVRSFVPSFVCSFIRSSIHSSVHSSIR